MIICVMEGRISHLQDKIQSLRGLGNLITTELGSLQSDTLVGLIKNYGLN